MKTKNLGELFEEAKKKYGFKGNIGKTRKRKKMPPTGLYNVKIIRCPRCVQGYQWSYNYKDSNGKRRAIIRTDLLNLRQEVRSRKLPWYIVNYDIIKDTAKKADVSLNQIL